MFYSIPSEKKPQFILYLFAVLTLGLLTVGFTKYTLQLVPLLALSVGLYLYFKFPNLYVGFTLWMHFIMPEVQRFIDFKLNSLNQGYLILIPNLVTFISVFTFIKYLPKIPIKQIFPFLLVISSSLYSLAISIIKNPPRDFLLFDQFPALIGPIFFGFHLYINWKDYPAYRKTIESVLMWGSLILGIYAVFQFSVAPNWDQHWLNEIQKWSYGLPEALKIRVWSGTSDFQTYATISFLSLLILLYKINWLLRIPAISIASLGIILTQARAAWISAFFSSILFLGKMKNKMQIKILILLLFVILVTTIVIYSNETFYELVSRRLGSFLSSSDDTSLNIRKNLYDQYFDVAASQFIGVGIAGNVDLGDFYIGDAPLFIYLFYFGWIGFIPYLTGLFTLLFQLCGVYISNADPYILISQAFVIGLILMIGFNNILMGTIGFLFWSTLCLGLAGCHYNKEL